MSRSERNSRYRVGYGKPPAEHRFRKGQSGNPKGRPKKAKQKPERPRFRDGGLSGYVEQEGLRKLRLHENGKPVEMTAAEALLRSLMADGIKGNRLAKRQAYELLRQGEEEACERRLDTFVHFKKKKAQGEAEIARCEKKGLSPPRLYPHPDDILLDEAKVEVHILGPTSADEAIPFERGALIRDWFFARSVFEEKCGNVTTFEHDGESAPVGDFVSLSVESSLPPSFQRDEWGTIEFLMELRDLTKRQLQKRMKALMAQIADMPDTIEDQLAKRKGATNAVGIFGEAMEAAAAEIAKKAR